MIDSVLGNLHFNTGWKMEAEVNLFGETHRIIIKAHAYYETDGLTPEQKRAFSDYKCYNGERQKEAEALLYSYAGESCKMRFCPRSLLFERDGEYALLCDDKEDPDGGIAVVLAPEPKVILQDDYL